MTTPPVEAPHVGREDAEANLTGLSAASLIEVSPPLCLLHNIVSFLTGFTSFALVPLWTIADIGVFSASLSRRRRVRLVVQVGLMVDYAFSEGLRKARHARSS